MRFAPLQVHFHAAVRLTAIVNLAVLSCVRSHAHMPGLSGGWCMPPCYRYQQAYARCAATDPPSKREKFASRKTHTQKQHIHNIPYTVYTIIRYYALQYLLITITLTFIRCGRSAYLCQAPFTAACSRRQSSSSLTLDFLHFIAPSNS